MVTGGREGCHPTSSAKACFRSSKLGSGHDVPGKSTPGSLACTDKRATSRRLPLDGVLGVASTRKASVKCVLVSVHYLEGFRDGLLRVASSQGSLG